MQLADAAALHQLAAKLPFFFKPRSWQKGAYQVRPSSISMYPCTCQKNENFRHGQECFFQFKFPQKTIPIGWCVSLLLPSLRLVRSVFIYSGTSHAAKPPHICIHCMPKILICGMCTGRCGAKHGRRRIHQQCLHAAAVLVGHDDSNPLEQTATVCDRKEAGSASIPP